MRCFHGWAWSILAVVVLTGCQRDEVRVYEAPRDAVASAPASPRPAADPAASTPPPTPGTSVPWIVPPGWEERPNSSGMRVASYGVTLPDGREMDVSVVALGEQAGTLLDNVNRWRRELALAPVDEAGLDALRSPTRIGRQEGFVYDLVSDGPVEGSAGPVRTLAAILPAGGMTVFFKAKGDARLVADQRANFVAWLGSVQTGPSEPAAARPATAGPGASAGTPSWTVPAHWREAGPKPMRTASFEVPGPDGTVGDVSVSSLGGDGGGLLANVNRWRGQVGLAALDEAGLKAAATALSLPGGQQGVLVDLDGQPNRILAAVVPAGDRTWFLKLTAPSALVAREREAFVQFVESIRF